MGNNNVICEDDIFGNTFIPNMNHPNSPLLNNNANQFMLFKQPQPPDNTLSMPTSNKKRKREEQESDYDEDEDDEEENDSQQQEDESEYDDDDYIPSDDCANSHSETKITNVQRMPLSKKRKLSSNDKYNRNHNHKERRSRFACTYCSKSFMQNCHLSRHIREKHSSTKPLFECRICDKSFNQRSNLKVHLRSHSSEEQVSRPWLCTECYPNRRFTRKSSLKRHWLKKHKTTAKGLIAELEADGAAFSKAESDEGIKHENEVKSEEPHTMQNGGPGMLRFGDIDISSHIFSVPCNNI